MIKRGKGATRLISFFDGRKNRKVTKAPSVGDGSTLYPQTKEDYEQLFDCIECTFREGDD